MSLNFGVVYIPSQEKMIWFPANGTEASDRLQNSVSNQPRQTQWFKQLPPFSLEIAREWFNPNVDPNHHVWPQRLKFKHQCFFQGAWNPYPYLLFQTPSYASFVGFILAKYKTALQKHEMWKQIQQQRQTKIGERLKMSQNNTWSENCPPLFQPRGSFTTPHLAHLRPQNPPESRSITTQPRQRATQARFFI